MNIHFDHIDNDGTFYDAIFPTGYNSTPLKLAHKANTFNDTFQLESQNLNIIKNWYAQFLTLDRFFVNSKLLLDTKVW